MSENTQNLPSDEAFGLLGDETRVAILRAVWESSDDSLAFSEIRSRIGNPDSGQFNYHITKLKGHFLHSDGDGYRLTQAGRELVRAVLAGTITDQPETIPARINASCGDCGGELVARYDEYGIIECEDCEKTIMWNEFPPAGLAGRTAEEFATTFDRWTVSRFWLAMQGICPNCAAEMSSSILESDTKNDIGTQYRCKNCKYEARVPLFGRLLFHPAVISFYYERGINVMKIPYWQMQQLAQGFSERVTSKQPWRAEVVISHGDRTLQLLLDDSFEVIEMDSWNTE